MTGLERIDVEMLYPAFLAKLSAVLSELQAEGYAFVATSGYRSYADQEKLYSSGRTVPGHIVTNARPGFSAHNWGIGVDFACDIDPVKPGLQPDWSEKSLRLLADMATKHGLESGLNWKSIKDGPHVQLPIKAHGIGWADLIKASPHGALAPAWALLDGVAWN